jgi:hypothetical protein
VFPEHYSAKSARREWEATVAARDNEPADKKRSDRREAVFERSEEAVYGIFMRSNVWKPNFLRRSTSVRGWSVIEI